MKVDEVLERYYGFKDFKPIQRKLIFKILGNNDVLAILKTGYGKSLIYQIAGLMLEGITVVITPLISLMKDQVDSLNRKNIKACYINSLMSLAEQKKIYERIDDYRFIYVSPERLESKSFLEAISKVSLVVIDEAHTLLWGLEFRKSMLKIKDFVNRFEVRPRVCAFTATASIETIKFIIKILGLKHPYVERHVPYNSKNEIISLRGDSKLILNKLLKKNKGKLIIYALTRKRVMEIYETYKNLYRITYYHGKMAREDKNINQDSFTKGVNNIIVATVAFGMGIDIPDIKTIILYDLPLTLGDLIQEIGRAGRDGSLVKSYLILNEEGLKLADLLIKNSSNVMQAKREFDEVISFFYKKDKKREIFKYFMEI